MNQPGISEEVIESAYQRLRDDAEKGGYLLNPDTEFVKNLVRGLLKNGQRYGSGSRYRVSLRLPRYRCRRIWCVLLRPVRERGDCIWKAETCPGPGTPPAACPAWSAPGNPDRSNGRTPGIPAAGLAVQGMWLSLRPRPAPGNLPDLQSNQRAVRAVHLNFLFLFFCSVM
jgi:ferredoxin-thioredoxin reductase catalytic subunit